jgi:hypothetical protein
MFIIAEKSGDFSEGDARRFGFGIAVDTRRDGRESDGSEPFIGGDFQATPVAGRQQRGFALPSAMPDRTHSVYDAACPQEPRSCRHGLAGGQAALQGAGAEGAALRHYGGTSRAVNGPIHAAASKKPRIGRVDDSPAFEFRYIPGGDDETAFQEPA